MKNLALIFATCLCLNQASVVLAQTNTPARQIQKYSDSFLDKAAYGFAVLLHELFTSHKWPDSPAHKKIRLEHCAEVMRSAIDTNQIELDCLKLTNQPEVVLAIRNYTKQTVSDLNEAASFLTNANLHTYMADFGEAAEMVNPKNKDEWLLFIFNSNGSVSEFENRNNDKMHVKKSLRFYENGRVAGDAGGHIAFRANGEIDHCFINGKYILIPITPSRYVAKDAEAQRNIYNQFCQTQDPVVKDQDARRLSNLWHDGLLDDSIKDQLTQEHYHLELRQIFSSDGIPDFGVQCSQTFPFPDVYTDFTPTQFVNDQIKWAPSESQRSCSMTVSNDPITSQTGGVLKSGDVLQYKIDLTQTDRESGRQWQISLWSNKLVLQKLRD
jgi:hypothetical protein